MLKTEIFEENVKEYDRWYDENVAIFHSEIAAIRDQMLKMAPNIRGIEVGLGTGRFSEALGIREGIEPSKSMSDKAIQRGIEVIHARAEHLPYKSLSFDFVLFVTVCFLDNLEMAFKEANRVLKKNGSVIVGFLSASGKAAKTYEARRADSTFYKNTQFYSAEKIQKYLKDAGFSDFEYVQTLFGSLDEIEEIQPVKPGCDRGSFVVVKARKR